MTEEKIEMMKKIDKIVEMNQRLLLMLGFCTTLILELHVHASGRHRDNVRWIMEAIDNVVYKDEPLPPMP